MKVRFKKDYYLVWLSFQRTIFQVVFGGDLNHLNFMMMSIYYQIYFIITILNRIKRTFGSLLLMLSIPYIVDERGGEWITKQVEKA